MRRESDFVLEQAAWPAMLLEADGRICRVNQAVRRIFDLPAPLNGTSLALLWDDEKTTPEQFLREHIAAGTTPLKLRAAGGAKAQFVAHITKVDRDAHSYVVLQLFKDTSAAFPELTYAPPVKEPPPAPPLDAQRNRIPPGLSNAAWPVLLVDAQGVIARANPAASRLFGARAAADGSSLAALCAPEDTASLSNLLANPAAEPAATLKFRVEPGTMAAFRLKCCPGPEIGIALIQLFDSGPASQSPPSAAKEDDDFLLQNAEWPVLLLQKNGKVLRANLAAVRAFGSGIEKADGTLASIWPPGNRVSALEFLALPPSDAPLPLSFTLKSGLPGAFLAQLCLTSTDDVCLLQLLKETASEAGPASPLKPAPAPAALPPAFPPASAGAGALDASLAHKQKLDCALQLARSVALDFNNALTSILGHASLLLSKAEAGHPWRNSLGEIEKSAARAAEIANDLASFSRQEKEVRVQSAGNLNTLAERTVEAFQISLQKPIQITCELERKLFTASFDEAKLQQALIKVLENAVEAIEESGKIKVQTRNLELTEPMLDRTAKLPPGNYVCVEISDTGAGIAPDVMPRIFEPFFTTKGARHRGLGLAWLYGIITNHGGAVAVSSQPGSGAAARIYLPATRKIVRAAPIAAGDLNGTQTILFVDDEDLLLTMGQMVLSSYGYTVLTARSGKQALDIFAKSKKKIDLVITDLVMPNMSGRELTEAILHTAPGTRILWSSGYARTSSPEEQERYLQKPFTSQDLLRKVKHVLTDTSAP